VPSGTDFAKRRVPKCLARVNKNRGNNSPKGQGDEGMADIKKVVEMWNKDGACKLKEQISTLAATHGKNFQIKKGNHKRFRPFVICPFLDNNGYYVLKEESGSLTIRFCFDCTNFCEACSSFCLDCQICEKKPKPGIFQQLFSENGKAFSFGNPSKGSDIISKINPKFDGIAQFIREKGLNRTWFWWNVHKKSKIVNFIMYINDNSIDDIVNEIKEFIDATYIPFSRELESER
jgi:hypothetical protein